MIGFWNKSVYITYVGAFLAVAGLLLSIKFGNVDYAFAGMILAAICDMFDGKVARSIKNRQEVEKDFGVEIDSLGDIICFIVVPAITIFYHFGLNEIYQIIFLALYAVCGIIRLAYFNVVMSDKNNPIKCYTGLPVPPAVFIFGIVWLLSGKLNSNTVNIIYTILVPIIGFLHISKIKIKKITAPWFYISVTILGLILITIGFIL